MKHGSKEMESIRASPLRKNPAGERQAKATTPGPRYKPSIARTSSPSRGILASNSHDTGAGLSIVQQSGAFSYVFPSSMRAADPT